MIKTKGVSLLVTALILSLNAGCAQEKASGDPSETTIAESAEEQVMSVTETATDTEELDFSKMSTFELSSEDLHDGVWDTVITKTLNGENRSPQLSWTPVEGAGCYVIVMIDITASCWGHWISVTENETELPAGWAPETEYVGPYPPGGTHEYEIDVLALKHKPEKINLSFNSANSDVLGAAEEINGSDGNIISYGQIIGTYTYGD